MIAAAQRINQNAAAYEKRKQEKRKAGSFQINHSKGEGS